METDEPSFQDDDRIRPGAVEITKTITVQVKEFSPIKVTITLEEPYSGRNGDTRDDKVRELTAAIRDIMLEQASGDGALAYDVMRKINHSFRKRARVYDDDEFS